MSTTSESYSRSQQAAGKPSKTKYFFYTIENRGKKWAILTLIANESFKNVPTFFEGSAVKGVVKLSLDRPEYIYSVYISIRGEYLTGNAHHESFVFLDITHTLWSPTYGGGPLNGIGIEGGSSSPHPSRNTPHSCLNGPLIGEFSWPFAVNLPREVLAPLHGHRRLGTFQLPQTFNDTSIRSKISYTFTLTFKRHGILSEDDKITIPFGYIPVIRPPPFPRLRQFACQSEEGTPLLGPTVDQDGWHSLTSLELTAILFKSREAHVQCTLFLGKPLSYTRGAVVPLYLRLESDDEAALDLLASPQAITARVRRRIRDYGNPGNHAEYFGWWDSLDHSQRAVWWHSTEIPSNNSGRRRSLQGEIHLKPGMSPTSALGPFRIEYSVVLFNFKAPGLAFPDTQLLQEQRIEIATAFAPGPPPRAHTPAVYEPDIEPPPQSEGFLSMRFY